MIQSVQPAINPLQLRGLHELVERGLLNEGFLAGDLQTEGLPDRDQEYRDQGHQEHQRPSCFLGDRPGGPWLTNGQLNSQRLVSSGSAALDRLLPDGGFRAGWLVEWLSESPGSGASLLALLAIRDLQRRGATAAIIDSGQKFYPPAAAAWGVDLSRTIVIRPANASDELWALDQSLRCPHLAATVAWPDKIDSYGFRRLQLAAEESGTLGLLIRPASVRREPTWAHVRLAVATCAQNRCPPHSSQADGWRWRVRLLRCRGGFNRGEVQLQIDEATGEIDETHPGNLAAQLAASASVEQTA